MKNKLRDLDLNLMKLLKAVVETKNTHLAAEQLKISQTSVSRGLAKLRETFGDQLFLRKAHGVEPSELAEKLAEAADEMLNPIAKVMESYYQFDPKTFDGKVSIVAYAYLLDIAGAELLKTLQLALPNAKFELDHWQSHSLVDILDGKIDYAIQLGQFPFPQGVYTHLLDEHCLGIVARKDHPVLCQSNDWEEIYQLPVVQLYLAGINYNKSALEEFYSARGKQANVILKTHSLKAAVYQLISSDSICFSGHYMSDLDDRLQLFTLPASAQQNTQIVGGYLQTRRGYPLQQYLHQVLQTFFDDLSEGKAIAVG
ncbi:LysR family transcriptional regulator [Vibrio sp. ZSDZ65]|uniref:LysR family transcriptional regulator n=1 Tax=Vibrio qingdaonensis TaxID=2829491 RepID=A0A9X3HWK8_9VIBR|nr:LysR family transcriptional regulator [Vibrio qingdaonensis]MCW8346343.1 LysR family transcriptional regulator [Vibrio qingdaonensis]